MKTISIIFLTLHITYFVTFAIIKVGKTYEAGTYPWYLPLLVLAFVEIPAMWGYFIGKES